MRWTVVGCSGSFAGPVSAASCYLLGADGPDPLTGEDRSWNIAFDLGNGALGALQRHLDPGSLDAIVVSHLHPDHFLDLCGLDVYLTHHPLKQFRPVPVFGPRRTAERIAAACDLDPISEMTNSFAFHPLTAAESFRIGPATVTPQAMRHPVEAFGFRIDGPAEDGGRATIAYTGDTDECDGLTRISRNADLLVAEAAFVEDRDAERGIHLTGRRAAIAADGGDVKRLLLTHIPPWNEPDIAAVEASQVFSGEIITASSNLVIAI